MLAAWLVLVDTPARAEILPGLAVSLAAAATTTWLQAANFARFAPHWSELMQVWRIPWYLIEDTVIAFRVLGSRLMGRRLQSAVRCVDFDAVADDPHFAARLALVIGLNTIPPNSIVIGVDRDKKQLVFQSAQAQACPAHDEEAVALASLAVFRGLTPIWLGGISRALDALIRPLRALHSGHIGDYIAWLTLGVAILGGVLTLTLR